MMITTGLNTYENLVTNQDYLDIIEKRISYEFANEIRKKIDEAENEAKIAQDRLDSDLTYYEAECETYMNLLDEINSMLQQFIVPIQRGDRINREKTIVLINTIIKMIDAER